MIEFLRGRILSVADTHLVVEAGAGVGYGIDMPDARRTGAVGEEAALFIYLHVQEDALRLYGFTTAEERDVFLAVLSVSGIGPRTALGILAAMDANAFGRALVQEDLAALTKLPGVGKKTAERLIIELREKAAAFLEAGDAGLVRGAPRTGALGALPAGPAADATAALVQLGCKLPVAERAVAKARELLPEDAPVEEIVREALRHRY